MQFKSFYFLLYYFHKEMHQNSETYLSTESSASSSDDDAIDAQKDIFCEASQKVETSKDTPKRAKPIEVPVITMQKLNQFATISKLYYQIFLFYRF